MNANEVDFKLHSLKTVDTTIIKNKNLIKKLFQLYAVMS
jgi:hypothetical protein